MAKILYCWRCLADIPMLNEAEWAQIHPLLMWHVENIQRYRASHGVDLAEARRKVPDSDALDRYFELTGVRESDVDAIWHHRISRHGPPCRVCSKPLRSPQSNFCAACGASTEPADH
ncbi:hypothetical protein [Bosea sp. (in: a-proteobacteria)]|uniref:hypothetical protein n=1 Tax=Bosea sp. (in: a-proteobacteria) TaxID=1871050 RepID=UPI00356AE943